MPTLNKSLPIDQVIGVSQFPGAVFHQNGAYFDRAGKFVGGDESGTGEADKDAQIAALKAQLATLKNGSADAAPDTAESVQAEVEAPAPHGLADDQYDAMVALGVDIKGMDEAKAKDELIAYGDLQNVDGLTRVMKVSTIVAKILEAEEA